MQNLTQVFTSFENTGTSVKNQYIRFRFPEGAKILEVGLDPEPQPELGVSEVNDEKLSPQERRYLIAHRGSAECPLPHRFGWRKVNYRHLPQFFNVAAAAVALVVAIYLSGKVPAIARVLGRLLAGHSGSNVWISDSKGILVGDNGQQSNEYAARPTQASP